jgi:predicted transcriptional regulator of viral defense system
MVGKGSDCLRVQEGSRRKNADAVEGIKRQQIEIASEDCIGAAMCSGFKEFVVARVAADADGCGDSTTSVARMTAEASCKRCSFVP